MEVLRSEILYFKENKWLRHGYKANKWLQLALDVLSGII